MPLLGPSEARTNLNRGNPEILSHRKTRVKLGRIFPVMFVTQFPLFQMYEYHASVSNCRIVRLTMVFLVTNGGNPYLVRKWS